MYRIDFSKHQELTSAGLDEVKTALRQYASGVTIVTSEANGVMHGITVSSFTSISMEPPVVMVAINNESSLAGIILDSEHFAVNILSEHQQEVSALFAMKVSAEQKFRGLDVLQGKSGSPIIRGSLAVLDCILDQTLEVGSHTLMFGRIIHTVSNPDPASPLVYYHRTYRKLK